MVLSKNAIFLEQAQSKILVVAVNWLETLTVIVL